MTAAAVLREPKDFASEQEIRWCPGCGDYAVLRAVEKALAELGADPDRTVFVSGIGCAAAFPTISPPTASTASTGGRRRSQPASSSPTPSSTSG